MPTCAPLYVDFAHASTAAGPVNCLHIFLPANSCAYVSPRHWKQIPIWKFHVVWWHILALRRFITGQGNRAQVVEPLHELSQPHRPFVGQWSDESLTPPCAKHTLLDRRLPIWCPPKLRTIQQVRWTWQESAPSQHLVSSAALQKIITHPGTTWKVPRQNYLPSHFWLKDLTDWRCSW